MFDSVYGVVVRRWDCICLYTVHTIHRTARVFVAFDGLRIIWDLTFSPFVKKIKRWRSLSPGDD